MKGLRRHGNRPLLSVGYGDKGRRWGFRIPRVRVIYKMSTMFGLSIKNWGMEEMLLLEWKEWRGRDTPRLSNWAKQLSY